jgi:hypothetical protein
MSMGFLGGIAGSAAGTSLSQTSGSEAERARKDALTQNRQTDAASKAELASGIGQTEQDQETSERDADGRRLWESPQEAAARAAEGEEIEGTARQSKDATGQSGTQLDLTG